ncbi:retrovirus-related Pol polyprotein from transposon TNT 1-94 [Trifolium pratense]|uniref:Retrovirus-related Pol polyprotein from transposon TNT 1-94 n=1 Tax=Trifolium pratense TaxID=57577 RepID=A0A2K3LEC5_TRIPR|nr:retrovirus-related Pol polyprotein from transposon TNT 1-94 [Trifolium pratense]
MENLLRSKEFWSLIEHGVTVAPADATQEQIRAAEESKLKDLKVKNYLFQSIDRAILETILDRSTFHPCSSSLAMCLFILPSCTRRLLCNSSIVIAVMSLDSSIEQITYSNL